MQRSHIMFLRKLIFQVQYELAMLWTLIQVHTHRHFMHTLCHWRNDGWPLLSKNISLFVLLSRLRVQDWGTFRLKLLTTRVSSNNSTENPKNCNEYGPLFLVPLSLCCLTTWVQAASTLPLIVHAECCAFHVDSAVVLKQVLYLAFFLCRSIMAIYWSWEINAHNGTESWLTQLTAVTRLLHKQTVNRLFSAAKIPEAISTLFI